MYTNRENLDSMLTTLNMGDYLDGNSLPELVGVLTTRVALYEHALRWAVAESKLSGYTWEQIASQLGVTKQAASQRYGSAVRAAERRLAESNR
jgi:hypothetical protein